MTAPVTEALPPRDHGWLGSLLLFGGLGLLVLCVIDASTGLSGLPRVWHTNRPLWWLFAFAALAAGSYLLSPAAAAVHVPSPHTSPTGQSKSSAQLVGSASGSQASSTIDRLTIAVTARSMVIAPGARRRHKERHAPAPR